ncbi:MAG: hypothetical protein ACREFE_05050 [Limisphaerales bacterium]
MDKIFDRRRVEFMNHDSRLLMKNYRTTLESVETQFALIRFALNALSKNAIKGFLKARFRNELDKISAAFLKIRANAQEDEKTEWDETEEMLRAFINKKHKRNSKPSDNRFKIEFSEDRLNQSELLLLVAHFESFMKEIHRTFLNAAPAKVFGKRDTKLMLHEVFQDGFNKFLTELIIKEVKFLDSQRIERRAEYFSEHFGISFGSQKEIDVLKEIMEMRNKISHEIYSQQPRSLDQIKEQPLVPNEMLKKARQFFKDIPQRCMDAGAKTYQSYFR